jgi:hypothetical protein
MIKPLQHSLPQPIKSEIKAIDDFGVWWQEASLLSCERERAITDESHTIRKSDNFLSGLDPCPVIGFQFFTSDYVFISFASDNSQMSFIPGFMTTSASLQ